MDDLENCKAFLRYYRMPEETFDKLVQLLAPHLENEYLVCTICSCHRNCCATIMINVKFAVTMLLCTQTWTTRGKNAHMARECVVYHTWAFCYLWAACGHLEVESVGISVWWSDFSILQGLCKEIQPDNLPAKYLE